MVLQWFFNGSSIDNSTDHSVAANAVIAAIEAIAAL
jgi:hypothetical protein